MTPKFSNRPNGRIQVNHQALDGSKSRLDYFISRAVAVVGAVFADTDEGIKVLVTKRSQRMMDEKGKMCLPCGYLDWDESGIEAVVREIYEETSLYLPDIENYLVLDNDNQPFRIKDKPNEDKRQNISLLYTFWYDFTKDMSAFPNEVLTHSCHETENVSWMNLNDFYLTCENTKWAFNHDETIKSAVRFFNDNLCKVIFKKVKHV